MNLGIRNLDIYLTGKCNYRCEYCYGESSDRGDMDEATYFAALEFGSFIGAKTIELCGGEPLMCGAFPEYVKMARNRDFSVTLRTNGVFLDRYMDMVASECEWVGISIDGLPEINAKMRPARNPMSEVEQFNRPIEAISELKRRNPDIKILLATLVSRLNYAGLPDFAEYIVSHDIPVDRWKIYEFIRDKFRSDVNHAKFEMTEKLFMDAACKAAEIVGSRFDVHAQSAHTERVGANCLIVDQSGNISLLGKLYGNVVSDGFAKIITKLLNDNAFDVIAANKDVTYREIRNEDLK